MLSRSFLSVLSALTLGGLPLACTTGSTLDLPLSPTLGASPDAVRVTADAPSQQASAAANDAANFDPDAVLADLQSAQVVYLGETHDRLEDHLGQLEIIRGLWEEDPKLAIGMEMFQRPFQGAVDRYLAGDIDEAELQAQSEYPQRWGFDWELYAPFLRFAQDQDLPVLALNTPTELTRKVARQGLGSLTSGDQRYVPAPDEVDTTNPEYRAWLAEVFYSHHGHGNAQGSAPEESSTAGGEDGDGPGGSSQTETAFDRFVAAQVLWDETMAETIAEFLQANPDYRVVVLTGQGHVIYGYGIPDRVQRRLGADLVQRTVLMNPNPTFEAAGLGSIADQFWYFPR
ncbi:MAG: ChaN family lipoprotein [Prochlorothrix sp.]|nr:ChaN family lipoprotein [Prochlorothrix sp.]